MIGAALIDVIMASALVVIGVCIGIVIGMMMGKG